MFKVAVIGSRGFKDLCKVTDYLRLLLKQVPCLHIITGGARGVDKTVADWANRNGVFCEEINPIDKANKLHYLFRNIEILTKADMVVAFHQIDDIKSRGTPFVINYCKARGKYMKVIKGGEINHEEDSNT